MFDSSVDRTAVLKHLSETHKTPELNMSSNVTSNANSPQLKIKQIKSDKYTEACGFLKNPRIPNFIVDP